MKHYPSQRYHPEHGSKVVASEQEDLALEGWFHSPADFGVETCPGKHPDPAIAEKKAAFEKAKAGLKAEKFPEPKPVAMPMPMSLTRKGK